MNKTITGREINATPNYSKRTFTILKRISKIILIAMGLFTAIPEAFIVFPVVYVLTGRIYDNPLFVRAIDWDVEKNN